MMITSILKLSEIKKDPVCLLGWDRPAAITRYGDIVAYVVSPSRMDELLRAEKILDQIKHDNEILKRSNKSLIELSEMPF